MNSTWKPVLVVAVLLALLTTLLIKSRVPDLALRDHMHDRLQSYELHDTELSRDVLMARAGMLLHYDALSNDRRSLAADIDALKSMVLGSSDEAKILLGPGLMELTLATDRKLDNAEDFKSANAILRNSLAYVTQEGPTQQALMRDKALAAKFGQLSYAMLRYLHGPEADIGAKIDALLDDIDGHGNVDAELPTLIRHGRMIKRLLPTVDVLVRETLAAPGHARAIDLETAVVAYGDTVARRAQKFLYGMYLVSLLLVAYIVYQFESLRRGAATLRRANSDLRDEMQGRAAAHAALRDSEERFRAITDSAHEAIVSIDFNGVICSWNHGAELMFGYASDEALGMNATRLAPSHERDQHSRAIPELFMEAITGDVSRTFELTGLHKDDHQFPVDASLSSWRNAQGTFVTAILRDVTERKTLQETTRQQELRLIQANRMTTLGLLVAGVTHEVKNPNQAILNSAKLQRGAWKSILERLDATVQSPQAETIGGLPYVEMRKALPRMTDMIIDGSQRIERLVADIRAFVQAPPASSGRSFDLNDSVSRAVRLLDHEITRRTDHFSLQLQPDLPQAYGDPHHFEQVIVNLVVNSLDALVDRTGGVRIWTATDRGRLVVIVEDDGIGIPPENLARICEPFFTTKEGAGGTGLGLAITASILRSFDATLGFAPGASRGTRATVTLAVAGAHRDRMAPAQAPA